MKRAFLFQKKIFFSFLLIIAFSLESFAQQNDFNDLKNFSGSIQTEHQYYFSNSPAGIIAPSDRYASNSYFNLNYSYKGFIAGAQAESYLPALQGYHLSTNNNMHATLAHYFAGYTSTKFDITLGNFYDQFGNGLIFRSFEDRELGIDNVMRGVHVRMMPLKMLEIKMFYGKQRDYYNYFDQDSYFNSNIAGADFTASLFNKKIGKKNISLKIGGSFLYIHQDSIFTVDLPHKINTYAWAGRVNFIFNNYQLNAEFMQHTPEAYYPSGFFKNGSALLVTQNYSAKGGININAVFRRLELAALRADYSSDNINNYLNYLPSLTEQHTWLVSSIYPAVSSWQGEIGGMIDMSYMFKKGTALGGKYGTKLFVNASRYNDLFYTQFPNPATGAFQAKFFDFGGYINYSDINASIEKRWSKKFKSTVAVIKQYDLKDASEVVRTTSVATELLFTLDKKNTLRTELEHMWNNVEEQNWAAAVIEYTRSNGLSFFASDLNDYQTTDIHYFNVGSNFSKNAHRFMISYGKQRAGLLCVGGICRNVPSYMGFTASYNYNF
jgi:hypothetical protein